MIASKHMRGQPSQTQVAVPEISRRPTGEHAPLSRVQEQVWRRSLSTSEESLLCSESITMHRTGPLDVEALERSFAEIIRRHEVWRTTFDSVEGEPIQVIHSAPSSFALPVVDLSGLSEAEGRAEALRLATEHAGRPFHLKRGPLVRAMLVRLADQQHRLFITMHQSVVDAVSIYQVLPSELTSLYEAFSTGQPSALPELPIQYADFACWERQSLQGKVLEGELAYWRKQLADKLPVMELPGQRLRSPAGKFRGAFQPVRLSKELSDGLRNLSQREGVTLFLTLVAGVAALLSRYTLQEDVIIGTIAPAGRKRPEVQALLGHFLNPVPLRITWPVDATFRDLLGLTQQVVSEALSHDDVPFDYVLHELSLSSVPIGNPLLPVMISLVSAEPEIGPQWEVVPTDLGSRRLECDLYLELSDTTRGIFGRACYNAELFDADVIMRMWGHWETLLNSIVASPAQSVRVLPLLTEEEEEQQLVTWNDTKADYLRDSCLHEMIEAQVDRTPEAVALVCDESQVTYRLLNARANKVAHYLRKLGVGPEVLVGVCVERSPEMVVALLGVLKAGGAYVPLDPQYPTGRLALMLEDSGLSVLITQEALRSKFPKYRGEVVCLDSQWGAIAEEDAENCTEEAKAENLAYVIYTSGSTGKPKGVQITHRSLSELPGIHAIVPRVDSAGHPPRCYDNLV